MAATAAEFADAGVDLVIFSMRAPYRVSRLEPLVKALSDDDLPLRRAAAQAIGEIGPDAKAAVAPLAAALKDRTRGIREAAAVALWRIGKPAVPALTCV